VLTADVLDPVAVAPAVEGADAVLCAIGPTSTSAPTTVSEDANRSIVAAMEKVGARRLLTLSGSVVGGGAGVMVGAKALARRTFLRHVSADMLRAEAVVGASDLDWTIVRPPRLTDGPGTGRYRVGIERDLARNLSLLRADLATFLLAAIADRATVRHHVFVAS
jgi:putative NADH-flavin reductase